MHPFLVLSVICNKIYCYVFVYFAMTSNAENDFTSDSQCILLAFGFDFGMLVFWCLWYLLIRLTLIVIIWFWYGINLCDPTRMNRSFDFNQLPYMVCLIRCIDVSYGNHLFILFTHLVEFTYKSGLFFFVCMFSILTSFQSIRLCIVFIFLFLIQFFVF